MSLIKKIAGVGIVTSKGGHFVQISQLKSILNKYKILWIIASNIYNGLDCQTNKYYVFNSDSRNLVNLIKNIFLAFRIFSLNKIKVLISSGAGIAIPFFLIGKIFYRTRLIYIESYDFVAYPSLTGRIIYNIADLFLVQHKKQLKWYPKAKYWGSLL